MLRQRGRPAVENTDAAAPASMSGTGRCGGTADAAAPLAGQGAAGMGAPITDGATVSDLIAANKQLAAQLASLQRTVDALTEAASPNGDRLALAQSAPGTSPVTGMEGGQMDKGASPDTLQQTQQEEPSPTRNGEGNVNSSGGTAAAGGGGGGGAAGGGGAFKRWWQGLVAYAVGDAAGRDTSGSKRKAEEPESPPLPPPEPSHSAPFSPEDIYAITAAEALRPIAALPPAERSAHRARLAWLAALVLFTVALQVALAGIICAGVVADGDSGELPAEWFSSVHYNLARVTGSRTILGSALATVLGIGDVDGSTAAVAAPPKCACNFTLPLNETQISEAARAWDVAAAAAAAARSRPGKADVQPPPAASCFLASAVPAGCTFGFEPAGAEPTEEERARLMQLLKEADRSVLSKRYSKIIDYDAPEPSASRARRLACTALAVAVLAMYVRREMVKAMLIARIVLSHTGGCLPSFFAPLYLLFPGQAPMALRAGGAVPLLVLPFLQAGVALLVMLASSVTSLPKALAPQPVVIIFNSAALLFILEIDNLVGNMVKDRAVGRASIDEAALAELDLADSQYRGAHGGARAALRRRPHARAVTVAARVFGHAYTAALGALCFAEVGVATLDLTRAVLLHGLTVLTSGMDLETMDFSSPFVQGTPPIALLARSRGSTVSLLQQSIGFLVFNATYSALVALLFEPPLPPAGRDAGWRAAHKMALLLATWAAFLLPADIFPKMTNLQGAGHYAFKMSGPFWYSYLPAVGGLWCATHVAWPLRTCRRRTALRKLVERLKVARQTAASPTSAAEGVAPAASDNGAKGQEEAV